ncbi:MAG: hypothetical protein FJ217_15365 [Ignavibacteria bacterium]|nr:hypothetical protein [Ignavibacteria bacterium]
MVTKLELLVLVLACYLAEASLQERDFRSITVAASGGVEFLIQDSLGRRSGYDPRTAKRYDEINQSYGVFSIDSENPSVPAPEPVKEFMTYAPVDGNYTVTVFGTRSSPYRLSMTLSRGIRDGADYDFGGVVDSNIVVQYQFRYTSVPHEPMSAFKVVRLQTLREDLRTCYTLKFVGEKELYNDLTRRLDKLDKYLSDKDSSKARHELEKFQEKIDQVRKETVKTEQKKAKPPKHFISKDAYDILTEDVTLLLKQLPIDKKGKGGKQSNRLQQKS